MKRKTTLLTTLIICFIGVCFLVGCSSTKNEENLTQKTNTGENDAETSELQVPTIRSELDSLLTLYGNNDRNPLSSYEVYHLVLTYNYPLFSSSSSDCDFSNKFDNYLRQVRERAICENKKDILYESLIRSLVWNYKHHGENFTEQQCEDIVSLIRLCEKQLETSTITFSKTDNDTTEITESETQKELQSILKERGYVKYSDEDMLFLSKNYNIPVILSYEFADGYLILMEELAKEKDKPDIYYEYILDKLIWAYDDYKDRISENQCEKILSIIKLCQQQLGITL